MSEVKAIGIIDPLWTDGTIVCLARFGSREIWVCWECRRGYVITRAMGDQLRAGASLSCDEQEGMVELPEIPDAFRKAFHREE